jgi:2',3'-cyclic-nucleotide 2'-phosphodiesterase (5'-nucleotidase family)
MDLKRSMRYYAFILIIGVFFVLFTSSPGQKIYLAYSGNLNCNLQACNCGGNNLGGMIQFANIVDSFRTDYPNLLLLDSGDFLRTYPLEDANRLMIELMYLMKYDAIGLGEQEYVDGKDFLFAELKRFPLPVISSNIVNASDSQLVFKSYIKKEVESLRIVIFSLIQSNSFDFILKPDIHIMDDEVEIREIIKNALPVADIYILLFHGSHREGLKIARNYPELSVIICGHTQEQYVEIIGNQIIVQPGVDAEYLGFLEIDKTKKGLQFHHTFYPVSPYYGKNEFFQEKVDKYFREIENATY